MAKTLGDTPLAKNIQIPMQLMEEQIKRNTEIFRQAMEVFTPFGAAQKSEPKKAEAKDLEELKEQLRALQTKIENM
jgi:polyhydroxyalkanoate synthesis regulator protein